MPYPRKDWLSSERSYDEIEHLGRLEVPPQPVGRDINLILRGPQGLDDFWKYYKQLEKEEQKRQKVTFKKSMHYRQYIPGKEVKEAMVAPFQASGGVSEIETDILKEILEPEE